MFCPRCSEERGPARRFCVSCGSSLEERPREQVARDLAQNLFLVTEVERWQARGDLPTKFATRLIAPYRLRIDNLEASLAALDGTARSLAPVPPKFYEPEPVAPPSTPPTKIAETAPVREEAPPPASIPAPLQPEPVALPDSVALATAVTEGPLALADLEVPPPSELEKVVERESSWSTLWKPFLYDNAIWFIGAFCIVAGSLYLASLAYTHAGDATRSLIITGMMLTYAAGFSAAGYAVGERKRLVPAGRLLGLIGAALAPVALITIDPLRQFSPALWAPVALVSLLASGGLLSRACDRFDRRLSTRVTRVGLGLMAWELAVPFVLTEPWLGAVVPVGLLFLGVAALRPREPAPDRVSLAFASLSLLYLAGCDLARLSMRSGGHLGLGFFGPVAVALGWVALRADRERLRPEGDSPRVPATTLATLALVGAGALASLVAERSAAAAAMLAALALADAARTYKRPVFVAAASFLGLFAYYLSPDLVPDGVQLLIAGARRTLGYPPGAPLPVAFAGVCTLPYLVALGLLARRARAQGQRWLYAPMAWTGLVLAVLLTLVAHSSSDVRPGLWSSLALVVLVGVALWAAEHQAAGYLFGYVLVLLAIDLGRMLHVGEAGHGLALGAAGLVIAAVAQLAPRVQRSGLVGEAMLVALAVPFAAIAQRNSPLAIVALGVGAALAIVLAMQSHSRLPAFFAALELIAATAIWGKPEYKAILGCLVVALLAIVAAGPEYEPPRRAEKGALPFGFALPWPAQGFDLFRDALALLAAGLIAVVVSFATVMAYPDDLRSADRAALVVSAVLALGLVRRYRFGYGLIVPVLLGVLACGTSVSAISLVGLALAAVAVAFTRWPALARMVVRTEGLASTVALGVVAALIPAWVAVSPEPSWLAASAVAYVLLLRWQPVAALWLPLAAASAWGAASLPRFDGPVMPAALVALSMASLGLLAAKRPLAVRALLGAEKSVAGVAQAPVHLGALVALYGILLPMLVRSHVAPAPPTLAALAVTYALLTHQTGRATWLGFGAAFAVASAWTAFPDAERGVLLGSALALAVLANLARALGSAAEVVLGARPARHAGNALAIVALLAIALLDSAIGAIIFGRVSHVELALQAVVIFLAARALGWAFLQPVALVPILILSTAFGTVNFAPVLLVSSGVLLVLAIATRRFPTILALVFLDRAPEPGRAAVLRRSFLVTMVLAAAYACAAQVLEPSGATWSLAVTAALLALAPLAAPTSAWWFAASLVAISAGGLELDHGRFRPALAVVHSLLALAGLLQLRGVRRALVGALAATDADARRIRSLRPYRLAIGGAVAWVLFLVGCALAVMFALQLERGMETNTSASFVAAMLPLAGAHLLFRRRGPMVVALVFALPVLAALYLAPAALLAPLLAGLAFPYALLAWKLSSRSVGRALVRIGLGLPVARRRATASLAFAGVVLLSLGALAATGFELGAWQTPATAGLLTVALAISSARQRSGRVLALALLPVTAHLGLAYVGIRLSTGRPHEAILGGWALASALLAVAAERFARKGSSRQDVLVAAHAYFVLGALELAGAIALMPGMRPSELLLAGLAVAGLGLFAVLRALETGREPYAYLAQAALVALYLLVRIQTEWLGARSDRDALASLLLGFAFLGLHAFARRLSLAVFDRPTRIATQLLPLLGALFVPQMELGQAALFGLGLALHYAAVSATLGGSKPAAVLSAVALNLALAATWIQRGVGDPQFYAIPFGATLLVFARLFRHDLSAEARFWLRTVGIFTVYVASAVSTVLFPEVSYVGICALVCVLGVLLGVMLRVRSYVYLGTTFLVVDVLGNMVRYGIHQPVLLGVLLTTLGIALVGGWVFFVSKREELLRQYAAVQALMRDWE